MIAIITELQKNILVGKQFEQDSFFNPIQDLNKNWIISEIEYYHCLGLWYLDELNAELVFITSLLLSEYSPKIQENVL
jgi:hypothetical protein